MPSRFEIDDRLWVVDTGRLHTANPSLTFAALAVVTVLVVSARGEDLVQIPARVTALAPRGPVGVLVVGKHRHERSELASFFDTPLVCSVDECAELVPLAGLLLGPGRARRSWLWRQAVDTTHAISSSVAQLTEVLR